MADSAKVLVTGANGFVGSALLPAIESRGYLTLPVSRQSVSSRQTFLIQNFDGKMDWANAIRGCQYIVHLAARVHVMQDNATDPLIAYRETNVDGTLNLAKQAAAAGAKRFIYVSSIKVHGESTAPGKPFRAEDNPVATDPYGISKLEAELGLFELARETGMEVVVIRPPLVYGPGVKANFLSMMHWLHKGILLPLGAIQNLRSFAALPNLIDLIITCLDHPNAANQVFLVSDGEDLSTPDLLRRTAVGMGRSPRLVPVPPALITVAGKLFGKGDVVQRLCSSLQVDISKTRTLLDWTPCVEVDQALKDTVTHFLESSA